MLILSKKLRKNNLKEKKITLPHREIHYVKQVLLSNSTIQNNKKTESSEPTLSPIQSYPKNHFACNGQRLQQQHNQIFNTTTNGRNRLGKICTKLKAFVNLKLGIKKPPIVLYQLYDAKHLCYLMYVSLMCFRQNSSDVNEKLWDKTVQRDAPSIFSFFFKDSPLKSLIGSRVTHTLEPRICCIKSWIYNKKALLAWGTSDA